MAIEISVHYTDKTSDPVNKNTFTLYPGETNTTTTSLVMMGQGSSDYAVHIMENLVKLLENFCSESAPQFPTKGQVWFNSAIGALQVATEQTGDTANWSSVGGIYASDTPPNDKASLWYDTSLPQLKVFDVDADQWQSVADRYVKKTGDTLTGNLVFTDEDTGLTSTFAGTGGTITPGSVYGPAVIGRKHAMTLINSASTAPTGSEYIIARSQTVAGAPDANARLLTVSDSGAVTVHNGTLSLNTNRITNVGNATADTDAVNKGQMVSADTNLQQQITSLDTITSNNTLAITTKVSKAGDTMTGALRINSSLTVSSDTTLNGGLTVTGGAFSVTGGATVGQNLIVSGNSGITGAITVGGNATFSSLVQMNATLIANGATTLKSTVAITGQATLLSGLTVGSNVVISGTTSMNGIATMNRPASDITLPRHVATKEYVDDVAGSLDVPDVPTGYWAGTTTLANIQSTFTDIEAYPPGTTIVYTYAWAHPVYWGNGTNIVTTNVRRVAVRTSNNGWLDTTDPL